MPKMKHILRIRTPMLTLLLLAIGILMPISRINAATEVKLAWDANVETNLAGYKLHYGFTPGKYVYHIDVGNVTEYTITNLLPFRPKLRIL